MDNIWKQPGSTILGIVVCVTVLVIAAWITDHDSAANEILKAIGFVVLGGGAMADSKKDTGQ